MESDVIVCGLMVCVLHEQLKRRRQKRKYWTRARILPREGRGILPLHYNELLQEDPNCYTNFLLMNNANFNKLLNLISHKITKKDTVLREAIPAKIRLGLTLRFLATGETYTSLTCATQIPVSTIAQIIPEVCVAIYGSLRDQYLKFPRTSAEWQNIAMQYAETWDFPNCIGSLDGKHILFRPAKKEGSEFYNYKGSHSIVLFALVDANYKFIYIDVGTNGRVNDAGVFGDSHLNRALESGSINLPPDKALPGTIQPVPFVMIGGNPFPLKKNIMKPFPLKGLNKEQGIHNYRLCRAKRTAENAFGILCHRFRVLKNTMVVSPKKVESIALAACALHNFLRDDQQYMPQTITDQEEPSTRELISGTWRHGIQPNNLTPEGGVRYGKQGLSVRNQLMDYFNGPGKVPWQDHMI